jgi:type 1 glutamine amidotransferase
VLAARYAEELRQLGFEVASVEDLAILEDRGAMQRFDLVLPIWTMGQLGEREEAGLVGAIRAGAGLVGIHCSADAFRSATDYQLALGGQFVWHPEEPVEYEVVFCKGDDELTSGLEDFTLSSEQYYLHVDPSVKVLATTTIAGGLSPSPVVMPVAWKRQCGRGRVAYWAIGHDPADHDIPQTRTFMLRAFEWAARRQNSPTDLDGTPQMGL